MEKIFCVVLHVSFSRLRLPYINAKRFLNLRMIDDYSSDIENFSWFKKQKLKLYIGDSPIPTVQLKVELCLFS